MSVMREYATGSSAIATTIALDPERQYQLEEIRVHLSAAGGATGDVNLTVTLDANAGAAYDQVLATQDMTAVTDYQYIPTRPIVLDKGDEIDIAYANGSSRTYGLLVIWSIIG